MPKSDVRVAAYGTVDELNSTVGWALTQVADEGVRSHLEVLQHDLFALGAELATPPPVDGRNRPETPGLPESRIAQMEQWIDGAEAEVGPIREFILPGGVPGAAALHVARTVCRRAERAVVALATEQEVPAPALVYLNRLSDLLFTYARLENARTGGADAVWQKG